VLVTDRKAGTLVGVGVLEGSKVSRDSRDSREIGRVVLGDTYPVDGVTISIRTLGLWIRVRPEVASSTSWMPDPSDLIKALDGYASSSPEMGILSFFCLHAVCLALLKPLFVSCSIVQYLLNYVFVAVLNSFIDSFPQNVKGTHILDL